MAAQNSTSKIQTLHFERKKARVLNYVGNECPNKKVISIINVFIIITFYFIGEMSLKAY